MDTNSTQQPDKQAILHFCKLEMLRPLRDQILRISGYHVDSVVTVPECLGQFRKRPYDLVLIDVHEVDSVHDAETLCAEVKSAKHTQLVGFVCNWRVAVTTDCPDEILLTEFDPAAFVRGVRGMLQQHS